MYSNFKDYCNVVYPLMLHELWSGVFRDYVDQTLNTKRALFVACITEVVPNTRKYHPATAHLTSLISHEEYKQERNGILPLTRGCLVILDLKFINPDPVTGVLRCQQKRKFGFVESFRTYPRSNGHSNRYTDMIEKTRKVRYHIWLNYATSGSVLPLILRNCL